jgi:hypothetical protein
MNYHQRKFRPISNSSNAETSEETLFVYEQKGNLLSCTYQGGQIRIGHLLGLVNEKGQIDMHYHQINQAGEIMTGICLSTPELMPNGKIRLHEQWQWTSGDKSHGSSILEEI